jgi:hypothetical protein
VKAPTFPVRLTLNQAVYSEYHLGGQGGRGRRAALMNAGKITSADRRLAHRAVKKICVHRRNLWITSFNGPQIARISQIQLFGNSGKMTSANPRPSFP